MFSSESFVVWGLKFKSLIYFVFIFGYGLRKLDTVFPVPLIEEAVFSPLYVLASFVKDKVSIGVLHLYLPHPNTRAPNPLLILHFQRYLREDLIKWLTPK